MTDKIAEIRARHDAGPRGLLPIPALAEALDDLATALAEVDRLRAAARNALDELNCIEEDGGHRCIRCDSEIDENHHVRLALRNALEGKP